MKTRDARSFAVNSIALPMRYLLLSDHEGPKMPKAASGLPRAAFANVEKTSPEPLGAHLPRIDGLALAGGEADPHFFPRETVRGFGQAVARGTPRPTRSIRARAERQLCALGEHDLFLETYGAELDAGARPRIH